MATRQACQRIVLRRMTPTPSAVTATAARRTCAKLSSAAAVRQPVSAAGWRSARRSAGGLPRWYSGGADNQVPNSRIWGFDEIKALVENKDPKEKVIIVGTCLRAPGISNHSLNPLLTYHFVCKKTSANRPNSSTRARSPAQSTSPSPPPSRASTSPTRTLRTCTATPARPRTRRCSSTARPACARGPPRAWRSMPGGRAWASTRAAGSTGTCTRARLKRSGRGRRETRRNKKGLPDATKSTYCI